MWSVSADRDLWWLSDAGELEIIHALFEFMVEHKGTVRVEAGAGGSEITFAFLFTAQWPVRIYPPVRYLLGYVSLQTGQTLSWKQKLMLPLSSAVVSGTATEQAIDALFPRPGRVFE